MRTGAFTYVAHPDLFTYTGDEALYTKQMRRLCEASRDTGVPLEINFLGIRDGRSYPSERFFRIAGEVGNEAVIGCDAHHVKDVADPVALRAGEAYAAKYGLRVLETVKVRNPKQ
jgi:histidinol-phosphatase (PHP family)